MFWSNTPVEGIQEAKLSQYKIINHSLQSSNESLATGVYQVNINLNLKKRQNKIIYLHQFLCFLEIKIDDDISTTSFLFHFSNLFAIHSNCVNFNVGLLDQFRG